MAPLVAHAVAVLHGSGQHIGDGFDAAMRMPRETRQVILRNVVAEIVEQQERIEVGGVAETERAAQVHARAFEGRLGFDEPLNGSNGHVSFLSDRNVKQVSSAVQVRLTRRLTATSRFRTCPDNRSSSG